MPEPQPGEPPAEESPTGEQPATEVVAPRWSGSAPVPPPTGKKRRRRMWETDPELPPPASTPPRDPTLELPTDEREALAARTPVDPWAEADPWPSPAMPHPPALPYPRPPEAPQPAGSAAPGWGTPPPGWQPPPGYVPVAVRRRRRWPKMMLVLTLLTVACCCGCPAYLGKPMWEQYPATAALPRQAADLTLRDDSGNGRAAQRLKQDTRAAHLLAEHVFAGVYADSTGKKVILFGTTGFRFSPDSDLDKELTRLTETYSLTDVTPIDTGVRGEYQRCGTGRMEGTPVVVCTWADHGSLATGLFTRRSRDDSARLLGQLRATIVRRG